MNTCERCGIRTTLDRQCGLCIALQFDHDRLMEAAIRMMEWKGGDRMGHAKYMPGCRTCAAIAREAA